MVLHDGWDKLSRWKEQKSLEGALVTGRVPGGYHWWRRHYYINVFFSASRVALRWPCGMHAWCFSCTWTSQSTQLLIVFSFGFVILHWNSGSFFQNGMSFQVGNLCHSMSDATTALWSVGTGISFSVRIPCSGLNIHIVSMHVFSIIAMHAKFCTV